MPEPTPQPLQQELEKLRRRVAELEHALEVQEWGGQLFYESNIPQLLLDFETGAVLAANAAARRFYGESTLREAHVNHLCAEHLDWVTELKPVIAQQRYGMRVSQQHTEHGVRTVEAHFVLVSLRGRTVVHLIAFDITDRLRAQEELQRAYRLESIGRLAGGIAHDFNNVLTAIVGFAELAQARVEDETARRYLEGILAAAEKAANLNRQLLAYARRQVVQLSPIDLGMWLQNTLEILRRVLPENIRLETQVEPEIGTIQGDPNLLLQILLNLVVNARDAMPSGGTLTISLRNKTLRRATESIPKGNYVTLTVADTGVGIAPEALPYIFEPFYTTKPQGQGTGLGLAAVQGAVQQLSGYIEVQSELGKGTRFTVYFPRLTPPTPHPQTENTQAE
ncbi:MAG: ATP-binding protein [Fimbriimonadales bacterium]|nr:ATP-binding protein [Fimbriimonadales bacterium]